MSDSPPWQRRALYALSMTLICLGTAEVGSRLFAMDILQRADSPVPERAEGAPNLQGNPYLLWEIAPGVRQERGITVRINHLGLRGPEWGLEKPPGKRRIVAIGDSSVFGFGVKESETFTAQLDQRLGDEVQVINAGIPGYSTYQAINLLQIRLLALAPDVIIVACLWSDNNFDSFVDKELLAAYSSFGSRRARALRSLLERSTLFRLLDYELRVLRKLPHVRRVGWLIGRSETTGERRVPIDEYARNLEIIADLTHDAGAELLFLLLPNEEDIVPTGAQGAAWDPYRLAMRDAARRHGAPLADLPAVFKASALPKEQLFLDEMHPTARGHHLIADAVQAALTERGWMEGGMLESDPQPAAIPDYRDPFTEGRHSPPAPQSDDAVPLGEDAALLKGSITAPEHAGGAIQIDVMDATADPPVVLGTVRLSAPGEFETRLVSTPASVYFIVYLDENGDGPGPGDARFDLSSDPVPLPSSEQGSELTIDLARGRAERTFAEGVQDGSSLPEKTGSTP